jgi:hypothetical protein
MANILKPSDELIVGSTAVALVYAIYSQAVPPYCDIRADQANNTNTYKSVKMAAITSIAAVGALSLLSKSPTVFTIGGAMVIFETWKYHYANFGADGTKENNPNTVG